MNQKEFMEPEMLVRNSFLWSEVRLVIAAVALFAGGVPPIYLLLPIPAFYGLMRLGLTLAWIVSGVASCYLLYAWNEHHQKLFGKKEQLDMIAFFVSVVSGINLGLVALLGRNIGMSILYGRKIFSIVGIVYLLAAWHLYSRWKANGEKVF